MHMAALTLTQSFLLAKQRQTEKELMNMFKNKDKDAKK